jgi:peptide-methionine (R)-S-oxide reductase
MGMKFLFTFLFVLSLHSCKTQNESQIVSEKKPTDKNQQNTSKMEFAIEKTDAEWQAQLTPEQYQVLRRKGTERPYTGVYDKFFEKGQYVCAACENPLFTSDTKFDSHCGWPSFDKAIKGATIYEKDTSYGMVRVEVMCAKCGGHLGHVFDDGPQETTGQRYCTNSVSIKFVPEK